MVNSRSEFFNMADTFFELANNTIRVYLGNHRRSFRGYEDIAKELTNVYWLVYGALDVHERNNSTAIAKKDASFSERVNNALLIYKDYGMTSEVVIKNLAEAIEEIRGITGESPEALVKEILSTYNAVKRECNFKVPEENPAELLVKASTRQWLDKSILKVEHAFLETSKNDWEKKVLDGDISDYTLPTIFKMYDSKAREVCRFYNSKFKESIPDDGTIIGKLTELPIEDILKKEKTVFANTYEYRSLSDSEMQRIMTSGLNTFLELLKEYHEERIKKDIIHPGTLFKEEVELLGLNGCFLGHKVRESELIALNRTLHNRGDRLNDSNLDYNPINLMNKLRILDIDGYIDFKELDSEWLASTVNDFITNQTTYLICLLESEKNIERAIAYSKQEQNILKAISQVSDKFMNQKSKKSLEKFERILQENFKETAS
ncbi:Uncharacterised protein [uncultured archaeon]|nr:Uncharacterised protein [uncultured archaeon]